MSQGRACLSFSLVIPFLNVDGAVSWFTLPSSLLPWLPPYAQAMHSHYTYAINLLSVGAVSYFTLSSSLPGLILPPYAQASRSVHRPMLIMLSTAVRVSHLSLHLAPSVPFDALPSP